MLEDKQCCRKGHESHPTTAIWSGGRVQSSYVELHPMIYAIIRSYQTDVPQILPGELHGATLAPLPCCHGNAPMALPISQRDAHDWEGKKKGGANAATVFGFNF